MPNGRLLRALMGNSPAIEYTAVRIQIYQTMQLQTVRLPVLRLGTVGYHNGLAVRSVNSKPFTNYRRRRANEKVMKRYPEPMAHGPEACAPSHPCGSC